MINANELTHDPNEYLRMFQLKTILNFLDDFEEKHNRPYVIAIDFDGTLAETRWPKIVKPNEDIVDFIKLMYGLGASIILWTCRSENYLDDALEWCKTQELEFDYINEHTDEALAAFESCSNKVSADIYIDDKAYNLHLGTVEGFIKHIINR